MKIVIVVPSLTSGGAERMAALWAHGFIQRGYEVCILTTNRPSPITYNVPSDVIVQNCNPEKGKNKLLNYLRVRYLSVPYLRKQLKIYKPDVVISILRIKMVVAACKGMKCKVIATEHNAFERPEGAPPMPKQLLQEKYYYNKQADMITVLASADKEVIGNRLHNVYVLPNVLAFEPVAVTPIKKNIILAVGRIDGWYVKGFDLLIKAWATINDKYPNWELHIVGHSPNKSIDILREIIKEKNVEDQVRLLPYRKDIIEFYKESAVFCLSSRYDGFGMALIEAMSQGCACVACDYKGRQKEIIGGENNGIVCEQGNIEALAESLDRVLKDEKLRIKLQQNAPQRANYYSLERIMDKWDLLLKKIIE